MTPSPALPPVVLAAVAHPDDIEFMMAGTLLRLGEAGAQLHWWNLCTGDGGSAITPREELVARRAGEARASAALARRGASPAAV